MNKILVVITAFSLGYVLNDLTEGNVQLIPEAQAEMFFGGNFQTEVRRAIMSCSVMNTGLGPNTISCRDISRD